MPRRPWDRLACDAGDGRIESPYLGRVRSRVDVEQARDELEKEIQREMASALGRAEDKLERALAELDRAGGEIGSLTRGRPEEDPATVEEINARVAAYNRLRDVARRCLWELVVHREALGIRRNESLKRFYPIPPKKECLRPRRGSGNSASDRRPGFPGAV